MFPNDGLNANAPAWSGHRLASHYSSNSLGGAPADTVGYTPPRSAPQTPLSCSPLTNSVGKIVCKYFLLGGCSRGTECPYSHDLTIEAPEGVDASNGFILSGNVVNANKNTIGSPRDKTQMTSSPSSPHAAQQTTSVSSTSPPRTQAALDVSSPGNPMYGSSATPPNGTPNGHRLGRQQQHSEPQSPRQPQSQPQPQPQLQPQPQVQVQPMQQPSAAAQPTFVQAPLYVPWDNLSAFVAAESAPAVASMSRQGFPTAQHVLQHCHGIAIPVEPSQRQLSPVNATYIVTLPRTPTGGDALTMRVQETQHAVVPLFVAAPAPSPVAAAAIASMSGEKAATRASGALSRESLESSELFPPLPATTSQHLHAKNANNTYAEAAREHSAAMPVGRAPVLHHHKTRTERVDAPAPRMPLSIDDELSALQTLALRCDDSKAHAPLPEMRQAPPVASVAATKLTTPTTSSSSNSSVARMTSPATATTVQRPFIAAKHAQHTAPSTVLSVKLLGVQPPMLRVAPVPEKAPLRAVKMNAPVPLQ